MQELNQLGDIKNNKSAYEKKPKVYYDDWFVNGKRTLMTLTNEGNRKWNEDHKKEEDEKFLKYIEKLKLDSLMDNKFKKCTFNNFYKTKDNEFYFNFGQFYSRNFEKNKTENNGLLIYGKPGTGKSFLSFCIANYLLDNGIKVIACSISTILEKIREYSSFGDNKMTVFNNELKKADLLIIDDLGSENSSEWVNSKIYEVIDLRYRSEKPLIVTTNLEPDNLKKKLTNKDGITRTYDRIFEICRPIDMNIQPLRIIKGREKQNSFLEDLNKLYNI
ncbi:DnaA ATPase domain-containing protein [Peptoniphilus vaginalis]|uniref:DnaA ATPase domain-containing protein n=1 Tax=Peptoniphilus vaginalis TaxID=1756987 RepID=UPI0014312FE4|nr:DnaA/Hda family protein [Peptoniphilus vaginalis]